MVKATNGLQAGLLRRLVMAPALSGLCLTKVSGYSYVTATLQITISDFLQGKCSYVCNCKQSFQQTGSWSGQNAGKTWCPKAIPCSAKAAGTEPVAPCPIHHIFPLLWAQGDSTFRMSFQRANQDPAGHHQTPFAEFQLLMWEEILTLKKPYASIFLIFLVTSISLATYVLMN